MKVSKQAYFKDFYNINNYFFQNKNGFRYIVQGLLPVKKIQNVNCEGKNE